MSSSRREELLLATLVSLYESLLPDLRSEMRSMASAIA